jgi:hypothetical protein
MSISNYAELEILDHLTGRLAWTAPTTVYVKLHLGDPGEDCTLSPAADTRRVAVSWSAAASGAISSSATLTWTSVTTAETYSHWSLWDSAGPTGGNPLWNGALASAAAVSVGDTFQITSLTLSLD